MNTILVTGGAGFIGSHLCEALLKKGNRVFCLDNFTTGNRSTILHLLANPNFTVIDHDITNTFDQIEIAPIHYIYNLACPASPVHYRNDAIKTIQTNTIGMIHMLELASKYGARLLQTSTSEIYGDPLEHPQRESYWGNVNPIGPRACYDEGKRVAETLCFDYSRARNVDIRIARIFNTYGPHMAQNDGRVVSNFIVQALRKEPITIYGDGTHTRSFCYVSDMVSGLMLLMNSEQAKEPVNLGNPEERTIQSIAETIREMTGNFSEIIYQPLPEDDPKKRKPDISRAQTLLGWSPQVTFSEGLKPTIEYFATTLPLAS